MPGKALGIPIPAVVKAFGEALSAVYYSNTGAIALGGIF